MSTTGGTANGADETADASAAGADDDEESGPRAGRLAVGIEIRVVARGALVGAAIALPLGLLSRVSPDGAATVIALLIMVGLGVGGYVAGDRRPDFALAHGALAGLGAYLLVQGLGVITTLARGDNLHPERYPFLALLSTSAGLIGGLAALRRTDRAAASESARSDKP